MKLLFVIPLFTLTIAKPQLGEHTISVASNPQVEILSSESDVSPDGTFHFSYDASDGTSVSENGALKYVDEKNAGEAVNGHYEYIGDDGKLYSVSYYADDTGFHPEGDHIPKTPEAIERALEWAAEHPYKEES